MEALVVRIDGLTASFRHPHFASGRQPSYTVPPPTTLYGLVSAALGDFPDRPSVRAACLFRSLGRGDDVEHLHIATPGSGRETKDWPWPRNLTAEVSPLRRETLFFPTLELYLTGEPSLLTRLEEAFRRPYYPVSLGRSQDVATVTHIARRQLIRSAAAYLEPGLYPASARRLTTSGHLVTMPAEMDPRDRSGLRWGRFLVIDERTTAMDGVPDAPPEVWVDPERTTWRGAGQGVIFLPFAAARDMP